METVVLQSDQLDAGSRTALRTLWARAFGDRFTDGGADHADGGAHVLVLVLENERITGHASTVSRLVRFGDADLSVDVTCEDRAGDAW